eukprot:3860056-Prymnesium_polylepis.1
MPAAGLERIDEGAGSGSSLTLAPGDYPPQDSASRAGAPGYAGGRRAMSAPHPHQGSRGTCRARAKACQGTSLGLERNGKGGTQG